GKSIEDALKITKDDVRKSVGDLPPIKYHCSVLAVSALREAIYDYMNKNNLPVSNDMKLQHQAAVKTRKSVEHD
ncbi:MAG: iron-sulfur cluster assembly scaffold protein, partial [Candidatus Aenigmatarchaeota archaeon]